MPDNLSPAVRWRLVVTLLTVLVLSGCATTPPPELSEGPTIKEIYQSHMSESSNHRNDNKARKALTRIPDRRTLELSGYTRDAANELDQLFPRLPNPTLCMFIDPHFSAENTGIPGYTTCFPMYETVEYALPGEVWR